MFLRKIFLFFFTFRIHLCRNPVFISFQNQANVGPGRETKEKREKKRRRPSFTQVNTFSFTRFLALFFFALKSRKKKRRKEAKRRDHHHHDTYTTKKEGGKNLKSFWRAFCSSLLLPPLKNNYFSQLFFFFVVFFCVLLLWSKSLRSFIPAQPLLLRRRETACHTFHNFAPVLVFPLLLVFAIEGKGGASFFLGKKRDERGAFLFCVVVSFEFLLGFLYISV